MAAVIAQLEGQVASQKKELEYARLKIQVLEERLRLQRIQKYGPGSEKLSSLQLELLEQEPGVSREEVSAESERKAPPPASERKKRKHPGRQTLPANLPRVERVIACTPEQCVCGNCGRDTSVIGYEVSEVLDVEPARYFVQVTKREKRACKTCPEQGVTAAPLPVRIIDKSLVSDGVIIDTVVNKYCDHNPLYRQSVALLRDAGIDISRATMCGWVMTIGEMLMPVAGAMRSQLLAGSYIQADETPVDVQTHDGSGTNHQAYLWQYGTPGGMTVFDFRMSRKREGPLNFLGNFEGLLQTDGYAAYDRVGGPKMVHAACWSHARRYFVDAVKLNKQDAASIRAVELINELFAIDAQARNEKMDHAARHALRHQKAPPVFPEIRGHVLEMSQQRCRPGLQIHACPLEKADPLPRSSRTGAQQQSCREFDEAHSSRKRQLDPHRQRTGRAANSRHRLGDRKLSPPQHPGTQLPRRYLAGACERVAATHRRIYPCRLGAKTPQITRHALV